MVSLRVRQPGNAFLVRFGDGRIKHSKLNCWNIGGVGRRRTRRAEVLDGDFDVDGANLVWSGVLWECRNWAQSCQV